MVYNSLKKEYDNFSKPLKHGLTNLNILYALPADGIRKVFDHRKLQNTRKDGTTYRANIYLGCRPKVTGKRCKN